MIILNTAFILFGLLLLFPGGARSAGVTSHLTFLARVSPGEFDDYYPWMKAGAFFPDSLYSCKPNSKLSEFAEKTHWPPFLIDSIKYWHATYGFDSKKKNSQDAIRLHAFLIGIFTHQVVDSSWHSLVRDYRSHGLLRVLSETEFNGNIDDAHQFIDVMGEFIGLSNVMRDVQNSEWVFYTNSNWSLPKEEDIMEILQRNGLDDNDISFIELDFCVKRGLSASISEVYTFAKRRDQILNVAYGISPRARDYMQECWLGGEFDLIAMLQKCLPVFQNLFNHDFDSENILQQLQLCGNLPAVSHNAASNTLRIASSRDHLCVTPIISLSSFGTSIESGKFKNDEVVYLAVGAPMEKSHGIVYLIPLDKVESGAENPYSMKPFTTMRGQKVDKFSYNGVDYLIVSEPGSNSLIFYHDDKELLVIRDSTSRDTLQMHVSSVQDIDGDKIPDLLLSGESYGVNETGFMTIVSGASLASYLVDDSKSAPIELSTLDTIRLHGGPFSLPYQHFGATAAASHICSEKGFLYVTCQNLGAVYVYPLSGLQDDVLPKYVIMEKNVMLPDGDASFQLERISSKVHGMFGKTFCTFSYRGENYFAISQHLFNKVFVYKERDGYPEHFITLTLTLEFEGVPFSIGFGSAIEYDFKEQSIFLSSPGSHSGKGAVWKVAMKDIFERRNLLKSDIFWVNALQHLYAINPLTKDMGVTNYGKSLKANVGGHLIVGVPQYGYGRLEGSQLTGAILIF